MRLKRYKFSRVNDRGWEFDTINLDRVNLFVGDSATGKSRVLNTIVNFSKQLVSERMSYDGDWDIDFHINGIDYNYKLVVVNSSDNINEKEIVCEELIDTGSNISLIKRHKESLAWRGQNIPKLSKNISAISMLKEEDEIRPIFDSFRRVVARRFFQNELNQQFQIGSMSVDAIALFIAKKDPRVLLNEPIDFHNKINLIKEIAQPMYDAIVAQFKKAFPFITDASIQPLAQIFRSAPNLLQAPVFCIKEKKVSDWIPVTDISSGMQKTFLLILDLYLMQDSGILLIDEYENSLGISAINFLPDLIYTISEKCQFIITSHHPYIINTIPIEDWRVFHRRGMNVTIKSGQEMKERYRASRQEQFVQLINDPFFTDGVE